jgi:hypothetical protein
VSDGRRVDQLPATAWFVVTLAAYVALGLAFRSAVLNWIVGPLWMLATLYLLPMGLGALRSRRGAR